MTDAQKKFVIGLTIGAALAGALVFFMLKQDAFTDDEDRPPIIVRGGSISFESSKGWKSKGTDTWRMDHDKGHWVGSFSLTFDGGTGACGPVYSRELTVYFKPEGVGVETGYHVRREEKNGSGTKREPVVSGPGLKLNGTTLENTTAGSIARVEFESGPSKVDNCLAPAGVSIAMLR